MTLEDNPKARVQSPLQPDGNKILVVQSDAERLVNIINAADLHGEQKVLNGRQGPHGLPISADGKTTLVANHGDGTGLRDRPERVAT